MTASLNKISAGDGYLYLTRQVAAHDVNRGEKSLAEYYAEKGESPGRWMGAGLVGMADAGAEYAVPVGAVVEEHQMMSLFGAGRHIEADRIEAKIRKQGRSGAVSTKASQLGRVFQDGTTGEFQRKLAMAYRDWNLGQGRSSRAEIPEDARATIRTKLALQTFVQTHGREPLSKQEFDGHMKREMRGDGRRSCAGFDVTFSPVKSISTLWAVAPREVARVIEAAQTEAVNDAVEWLEKEMTFTRRGSQGVRQVETNGLIAAAFVHRDSRAGDPDLHTHVAISNKVQARDDGAWLALDGRQIYQATVAVSERYNSNMERILTRELGLRFVERESDSGRRSIREIEGVAESLAAEWSKRRASITVLQSELVRQFEERHHRPPTPTETLALAQQATLDTRQAKHEPRSFAEQREQWRKEAAEVLGGDTMVDEMARSALGRVSTFRVFDESLVEQVAADVVEVVEAGRASFQLQHVLAEAERQARAAGVSDGNYRPLVEQVTAKVLGDAVAVGGDHDEPDDVPDELRRSTGESVYRRAHSQRYTTERILEAEDLIRAAGRATGGVTVAAQSVDVALLEAVANGVTLNPAQARLVREFATSGARLQLALAPAGTGKTTAMRVLANAWRDGGGNVVAVGPTHVSVDGLRQSMDADGGTVAALSWALTHGQPVPRWAEQIDQKTLVVVDEAGMAGTFELATLTAFVMDRGGSVRLIGDNQQLAAVAAGGVLRDLAEASDVPVVSLDEVMRFVDAGEGRATLALRTGDAEALGWYADRDRVHSVAESTAGEAVFEAWRTDTSRGWESLMVASTNAQVTELNTLARQHRISLGAVVDDGAVVLRDGNRAGAGDVVVTRTNNRRLPVSGTDWVKNRDRWEVLRATRSGGLVVRGERHGRVVTLPAEYVAASVELGYASTVHAAQGMTVDSTHALVCGTETRQSLYVALSRGRHENHAWVSTGAAEESEVWLDTTRPLTPMEVLEGILARDGQAVSASSEIRLAADPAKRLAHDCLVWQDSLGEAIRRQVDPKTRSQIEEHVADVVEGAETMQGWTELTSQLFLLQLRGQNPVDVFDRVLGERDLGGALNPVAVLSRRLDRHANLPDGPLPWLWGIPKDLQLDAAWQQHLTLRRSRIEDATGKVMQQATSWAETPHTAPGWAHPFVRNPQLLAGLALWRAAMDIPSQDLTPLGSPTVPAAAQQYRQLLLERVEKHYSRKQPVRWLVPAEVTADPYWEVVRRRLDAHADAGYPIVTALTTAVNAGPLPVEHPAAALWYRVQSGLDEAHRTIIGRQAPLWSDELRQLLPAELVDKASVSPSWGDLAQTIHTAIEDGHDPRHLITTAAALLPAQVEPEALGALLASRVEDLLNPPDEPIDQLHDPEQDIPFETLDPTRRRPQHADSATTPTATAAVPELDRGDYATIDFGPTSKERIVELHGLAAGFYRDRYTGSPAAQYMASRLGTDLTDQAAVVIGYAPAGNALVGQLRTTGANDQELIDAGLAKHDRHGNLVDVFRDRLVIGLHDSAGDLVGFVGRARPDAGPRVPKYLNTPTTRAFSKGEALFGLHEYQAQVAQGAELVRVEGPMDALAINLACQGKAIGVAPLGTALTAAQANLIASHTNTVWEATDTDQAGAAAAVKDHTRYINAGIVAREFILLAPAGDPAPVKDAAELLSRTGGVEQLRAALQLGESAPTLAGRVLATTVQEHSTGLAEGNANAIVATARQAAAVIAPLPPDLWQDHINLTADLIKDAQNGRGDAVWLRELVTAETRSTATAWQPPTVQDPYRSSPGAEQPTQTISRTTREQQATNRDALDRAKEVLDRLTLEQQTRHQPPQGSEPIHPEDPTKGHSHGRWEL